ncbi:V-type ATPase subunit [Candidatus Nanohalobium constans]|uniref:V/A-type H+/Na+-transporting ATPase subunit C n=1 Tax=Candidatus Nanohalobium constans TaxID=2565781 RepID=A0A5Q0UGH9_9ARCH|nr:V-type ATPase subunit [Candidatus Nanohalobium constans]QGA80717.1 V/A-type H+/Na+-transporting ATPase subunit C [Candidatus Nanohalobium constans]
MRLNKDYPYMYARVSAKRAKLFDQSDYQNLVKMGPNEITRKLGEGEYKEDIDQLGSTYSGVQLAELALAKNMTREMSELVEMADGNLQEVIKTYLRKYDILTIKRILRAKKTGEDFQDYLTPISGLSSEEIQEMKDKTFEEIKASISFEDSEIDYQRRIQAADNLSQIESGLDQAYYDDIMNLANKAKNQQLKDFIQEEVEYENLKMVLRMKKYGVENEEIRDRLLKTENGRIVEKVIKKDFEEGMNHLIREMNLQVNPEIEKVEHALEVHRLDNAIKMLHTQPLGLSSILGYIVAKITEVKNLRMLLRAKETGIQNQETIQRQLVLAR